MWRVGRAAGSGKCRTHGTLSAARSSRLGRKKFIRTTCSHPAPAATRISPAWWNRLSSWAASESGTSVVPGSRPAITLDTTSGPMRVTPGIGLACGIEAVGCEHPPHQMEADTDGEQRRER